GKPREVRSGRPAGRLEGGGQAALAVAQVSSWTVVVQAAQVGQRMLPSVVRNHGPCHVELTGAAVEPKQQAHQFVLPHRSREPERFVHRYPRHNAGVVSIALDGGGELVEQTLLRLGAVRMEVGHLTPDQEAEATGPRPR